MSYNVDILNASLMAQPLVHNSDLDYIWIYNRKQFGEIHLAIRGRLYGKLKERYQPGWNIAAAKDGPVAKRWIPVFTQLQMN